MKKDGLINNTMGESLTVTFKGPSYDDLKRIGTIRGTFACEFVVEDKNQYGDYRKTFYVTIDYEVGQITHIVRSVTNYIKTHKSPDDVVMSSDLRDNMYVMMVSATEDNIAHGLADIIMSRIRFV